MIRHAFVMLLTLTMLISVFLTSHAQEASPVPVGAAMATPVSPSTVLTTEVLATVRLPTAAIPPPPAIFDVWLWSLRPDAELTFATGDAPPSIAADVVLAGEYTVRSDGRLLVQRGARLEEVTPGTVATVRPGDAVIYVENQAAQLMRNPGDEEAKAISFGVYSSAPPSEFTTGPVSQEDWERSGLAGQDLVVSVEQLTVPPGASLPPFTPDVHAPQIFAVVEGMAHWAIIAPDRATPRSAATFIHDQVIWFRALAEGEHWQVRNDEERPLVLLQVTVRADPAATPVAATPVS